MLKTGTAVLFLVCLLTVSLPAWALNATEDYFTDRAVIRIAAIAGEVEINASGAEFNLPELQRLCIGNGIQKIEKYHPWAEKPEADNITDLSRIYVVHFPLDADLFRVIDSFKASPLIEYAEPYFIHKMCYVPDDQFFGTQWGLGENITQAASAFNMCRGNKAVVIAIVDSGIDMDHPDLVGNIWINYGEDVNGDSIIDLWDYNNFDDDGNGFVDDFNGWDFIDNDNYPDDAIPASQDGGHGTHCAGIASAQTDNGIGIASLGFDCSLMICRTGAGMVVYAGMAGVGYAIDMSADVISLSWGSYYYSYAEQQTFNYAHEIGITVIAAAGNDNSTQEHYPAAYDNVMSVAATNSSDLKAGFSNYGAWIDISAPGSSIYSTFLGASYTNLDGTSMACPFVAGLAGLVKSADMDLVAEDILQIIYDSADNIYPQNPGYTGMLGAGRINAYQALLIILPNLTFESYEITDDGNGDNRPDPGETCELVIDIENNIQAQPAFATHGQLLCEDTAIDIIDGETDFGDIIPGFSASNSADPFTFEILPCEPHLAEFIIRLSSGSVSTDFAVEIEIGRPDIIFVDDDGGDYLNDYYEDSFEQLDLFVDIWEQSAGEIDFAELSRYDITIWETGNELAPLNQSEISLLQNFLDAGKNLLLSSTNLGADIGSSTFYSDYLHASFVQDTVPSAIQMTGVEGHPFAVGTSLFLLGGTGAGNNQSCDAVEPIGGALATYTYNNTDYTGGVSYEGGYKLAYFAFPVEAITGLGGTTAREVVISNVLGWFGYNGVANWDFNTVPSEMALQQNYPNPFNPSTEIVFSLPQAMTVKLAVYDVLGRKAADVAEGLFAAGYHTFTFDGSELSSGIYFCLLRTAQEARTIKMMLLK